MLFNFLKLYRADVSIIVIFLYLVGGLLANKFNLYSFDYKFNIIISILISFISINFIYSLNSWFDADVDKINKPNRPIPAGLISKKQALIYSIVLGIISFIYPIILFSNNLKFIFFIFPIIGLLYSNKFFSFKRNKYLAMMLIIVNAIMVLFTGYFINGGNLKSGHDIILLLIIFFLSCSGIIPLKDMTDVKGDVDNNLDNWFLNSKKNKILLFSMLSCMISLILAFFIENIYLSYFFIINITSVLILFLVFLSFKFNFNKFYNTLLKVFIFDFVIEVVAFIIYKIV